MAVPDWDLLYCFPWNELFCQDTDECDVFWSQMDIEHTWMLFQSIQHLWWADVWEAGSYTASRGNVTGQQIVSLEYGQKSALPVKALWNT